MCVNNGGYASRTVVAMWLNGQIGKDFELRFED